MAERVREVLRDSVTYWLVRPAMRLSALVVERTAKALPEGIGLSARAAGSDGLVDTAGQRGVDVPSLRRTRSTRGALRGAEGMMQSCHSSESLESLGSGSHSPSPMPGRRGTGGGGKALPQRGKWWVLDVHEADHSLGTALCQDSGPMYESVLALLERLPLHDTRELMRLRAARLSDERFSDPHVPKCEEVVG